MFGNGIQVHTHSGDLFIDAELVYRQEQMLEAAREATRARQARATRADGSHGLGRLRRAFHRAAHSTPAVR